MLSIAVPCSRLFKFTPSSRKKDWMREWKLGKGNGYLGADESHTPCEAMAGSGKWESGASSWQGPASYAASLHRVSIIHCKNTIRWSCDARTIASANSPSQVPSTSFSEGPFEFVLRYSIPTTLRSETHMWLLKFILPPQNCASSIASQFCVYVESLEVAVMDAFLIPPFLI